MTLMRQVLNAVSKVESAALRRTEDVLRHVDGQGGLTWDTMEQVLGQARQSHAIPAWGFQLPRILGDRFS